MAQPPPPEPPPPPPPPAVPPQQPPYYQPPPYGGYYGQVQPPTEGMAIASLILGIVAFPTMCCTYGIGGVAFGVTALILGRVALGKIRAANGMLGGHGIATAGWICGLVAAILGALLGIFQFTFLILGMTGHLPNGGPPFGTFTPFPTPTG